MHQTLVSCRCPAKFAKADLIKDLSRTVISSKIERDAANTANYNSKQILTEVNVGQKYMLYTETREGMLANRMRGPSSQRSTPKLVVS